MTGARLGLDVGSTTVKAVALVDDVVAFRAYHRHRGRSTEEALALVDAAREVVAVDDVVVTGSTGAAVARRLGADVVHEVHAVVAAARRAVPGVRTIVELGGQDAKLVHVEPTGGLVTEMNERCAAGTGTVIDRVAFRLGLDERAVAGLGDATRPLATVSARCGVFAEADVVALVKAGGSATDALLALLDAIVRQNLVSLARGRPLLGPVCLLGGPNAFIPALGRAFERHLHARWVERHVAPAPIVVPPDAQLFAALGAALSVDAIERLASARGRRVSLLRGAPDEPTRTGAEVQPATHIESPDEGGAERTDARVGADGEATSSHARLTAGGDATRADARRAADGKAARSSARFSTDREATRSHAELAAGGDTAPPDAELSAGSESIRGDARLTSTGDVAPRDARLAADGEATHSHERLGAGGDGTRPNARLSAAGDAAPRDARRSADGEATPRDVTHAGGPDLVRGLRGPVSEAPASARDGDEHAGAGGLFVGLDAGSTTVKAVALDARGALVARAYRHAGADAFSDAAAVLETLGQQLGPSANSVRGFAVTGYAADLLAPVLEADCAVVETLAHARAARRFVPDADVVCDVGGQDIKVLMLDADGVRDFRLSHQCAAGNGALLEATAAALAVPLERVAEVTAAATRVPRFSVGCAVFLDTERVTAQRDGLEPADLLAGMTAVLPRNIWENVVAAPSLEALGDVFVLSGGVQRNAAAVKAQADYLAQRHPRARVVVHPYPGEAGAIGAALAAQDAVASKPTRFKGLDAVHALRVTSTTSDATRCGLCPSHCTRAVVTAERAGASQTLVTGNACERGADFPGVPRVAAPRSKRGVNLVRREAVRLFRRHHAVKVVTQAGRGLRVAIPRVLAAYRAAPLFTHYFEALGVAREHLVTGELTSEALWRRAAGRGTAEACFPAKVAQAHVADLLARREREPFDVLFFPAVTHAVTSVLGCADTASCPVVAGTPLVTKVAFGADADGVLPDGVRLLTPALVLPRRKALSEGLFESIRTVLPALTRDEHEGALAEAITAQKKWDRQLEEWGTALLLETTRARKCAVVMIGRPYHADPGLHHELGSELAALGRGVMTLRSLPHSQDTLDACGCRSPHDLSDVPFLTNSGDGERLAAARFVGEHPYLVAIELSAFKCGQDASLYGHVAEAARGPHGKPFLALHDLDETRPVASLRLRLRTFLDAVAQWEARAGAHAEGRVA